MDPQSREPLWRQLANIIRRAIAEEEYGVGQVIPSKRTLAEYHEVSIRTVNTAEEHLKAEGLLEWERGKGMYVVKKPG